MPVRRCWAHRRRSCVPEGGELLAERTTLRLGGPASSMVHAPTEADLVDAVREADESGTPVLAAGRRQQPRGGRRRLRRGRGEHRDQWHRHQRGRLRGRVGDRRGGGGLGCPRCQGRRARMGRHRGAVGHPRLGRRDADPERRRLRAGSVRDHRVRPLLGPCAAGAAHVLRRRLRLRLPHQPLQAGPGAPRRAVGDVPVPARRAVRSGPLRRAGRTVSASTSATGP